MNKPESHLEETLSQENSLLREQVAALQLRCAEAEEALNAIQNGSVDALVVYGNEGEQVYTIQGADHAYRILIESINEGAATVIGDGTILYCNTRFAKMLKMPLESMIGTSIYQVISPAFRTSFSNLLQRGLAENCREEIDLQCQDGSSLPVLVSLNSFSADGSEGVCLVASDLSEQKKVQEQVRQEAQRAATLSTVSRSLVEAGLNDQEIIDIIARSAVQLIGDACEIRLLSEDHQWLNLAAHYHPDACVNHTLARFLSGEALRKDEGFHGQVIQTGKALLLADEQLKVPNPTIRKKYLKLAEKLQISSLLIVPIRTRSLMIGTLVLMGLAGTRIFSQEDQALAQRIADQMALAISNARLYADLQNALEKEKTMRLQLIQSEKLSALSRMMASVVHEINNPIQAIKNWMYLARLDTAKDSRQAEYLDLVTLEIERIGKLVSNLRIFYRKPAPEPMKPVNLSKILDDVHALLAIHIKNQNITWHQENIPEPVWVKGIADQLKQVFLNIYMNAIEAMPVEGGQIHISLRVDPDNQEVSVSVQNSGPSIPPEDLPKLFEPFFTTKSNGTGLGLAVCYEIIQHHQGRITAESQPGEGATFTIWLPGMAVP